MTDHEKYKAMKSSLGLTNADIAEITGNTVDSIRTVTQPNRELPRWVKLAIWVWEKCHPAENTEHLEGQSKQFYCDERDKYGNTECTQQCMACVRDEQA